MVQKYMKDFIFESYSLLWHILVPYVNKQSSLRIDME